MKLPQLLLLTLLPLASLLQAGDFQTIWLGRDLQPLESSDNAFRKITEAEEIEGGYRVTLRSLQGSPEISTQVTSLDFSSNQRFGDYTVYGIRGTVAIRGQYNEEGKIDGLVVRYHPDGSVHQEIEYVDDQRHGTVTEYDSDGNVISRTEYANGERHGTLTTYHSDGSPESQSEFANGQHVDGVVEYFHQNGKLNARQPFQNGVIHGQLVSYYDNGQLRSKIDYQEGHQHGSDLAWYQDGTPRWERHYQQGKKHGKQRRYHANGQLHMRSDYQHGRRIGEHVVYHPSGLHSYYQREENGKTVVRRDYNDEGTITQKRRLFDSPYGPAESLELFHNNGEIQERRQTAKETQWRLSEEFDEQGNLHSRKEYLKGKPHGLHVTTQWDGTVEKALYKAGEMHGEYLLLGPNGETLSKGLAQHDQKVGPWIETNGDRVTYETWDKQGRRQGERRVTTLDGELLELAQYHNGVLHGPYEEWSYSNGTLQARGHYHHGERQGRWILAEDNLLMAGKLRGDIRLGEWRGTFDGPPPVLRIIPYNDKGRIHGRAYHFDNEGALSEIADYNDGVMADHVWVYKHGVLHERKHFSGDQLIQVTPAVDIPEQEKP